MFSWQDLRYALRLLRRSPIFTLLTIAVLSGGLGLSIFTFSFLHTAMVRPLPLGDGDRIVAVDQVRGGANIGIDAADLARMRSSITTLTAFGAYISRDLVLGSDGRRRVLGATAAESNIFEVTRTPPALGRSFRPGDGELGAEPVVVLGHRTWEIAFGSDSAVIGRIVTLSGTPTRVIGVMPAGFGFPVASDAWVPLGADVLSATTPGLYAVSVYARLARGVSAKAAQAELQVASERARTNRAKPGEEADAPTRVLVQAFPMRQMGDQGPLMFGVLNLLAALILLLACVNVLNVLLARANERMRETAVRLALGAPRARLVLQNLWETVMLCVAGGVLATGGAAWGLAAINRWAQAHLEGNLAFWWVWGLDRTAVLAAGAFVTATIAVLGGLASARATSVSLDAVLRDSSARSGGRREGRVSRILIATQVATVSVLMFFGVMSGIIAHRVATVDLGYDTRNLLSAGVSADRDRYATRDARNSLYQRVHDGMAQRTELDGVLVRARLADANDAVGAIALDGNSRTSAKPNAYVVGILGSLPTLGIALREGRFFDTRDRGSAVPVAMVSRAFAERHWPGRSPVGQRVRLAGLGETSEWRTVVGVVTDVLMGNPLSRDRSAQAVYVPLAQADAGNASVMFRHRGDAAAAQAAFYETLTSVDPLLEPPTVSTFDEILAKTAMMARSVATLFAGCFAFALLLAVIGTYGLMARSIGRRTREIGVRRALGATDGIIVQLLLGQAGRQLGIGALVALPVMIATGIGFSVFFPVGIGVSVTSGVLVTTTIMAVVLAATYVPTRQVLGVPLRDSLSSE